MDGSALFGRRRKVDPEQESAVSQAAKGKHNDIIKAKDVQVRIALGMAVVATSLLAASVGGNIYLGTLPKESVEYVMLDPQASPVYTFSTRSMPKPDLMSLRRERLAKFVRSLRSVRPDQKGQQADLTEAYHMTYPDSPARAAGIRYVNETQPYKRAESELVYVTIDSLNPGTPDTWHVTFTEESTDLRGTPRGTRKYVGILNTKTATNKEAEKKNPLGMFVYSYSFDEEKEPAK